MERLIKTEGCYIGIFDASSPMNIQNLYAAFMDVAKAQAKSNGEGWASLYYFNQQWIDAASRSEILVWIVLFDGIYKIAMDVHPLSPRLVLTDEQKEPFLGDRLHLLSCPSGRIIVASLSDLGRQDLEPAAVVEPGTYRVGLTVDYKGEPDHWFLEDPSEYPSSDGPDWSVQMQKA